MMTLKNAKKLILTYGILVTFTTPLSHAQDTGTLFDVKVPQSEVPLNSFQNLMATPDQGPLQENAKKEVSEKSWYWRVLEWSAISAAKFNTEKQNNGRPDQQGNFR